MDTNHILKMLDNAQLGHEDAVKWVSGNVSAIAEALYAAIAAAEDAESAFLDAERRAEELDNELYDAREAAHDFERDVADLERAMITLEEELAEARNALDEALNYEEA